MKERADIRLTFDGVADLYDRARPSYPDALFDVLFDALPVEPRVLEIGPGTGQATAALLARGADVTAVELGPNLAEKVRQKFAGNARLTVVNASFEDAPVEPASFDAVTVATAYHWIDHNAQVERPIELLRPHGVLGVIDLIQVDSPNDHGYFDRVHSIYARYGAAKRNVVPESYETAEPEVASRLRASGRYVSVDIHRAPWDQTYTGARYRDLLLTYSGTQMMPEPHRTEMLDQLIAVVDDEFDGVITRPLVATLTMARVGA